MPSKRSKRWIVQRFYLKSDKEESEETVVGVDMWLDWILRRGADPAIYGRIVVWSSVNLIATNHQPYHQPYSGVREMASQTFLYSQAFSVQLKGETPIRSLYRLTMKLPSLSLHTWRNAGNKDKIKPTTFLPKLGTSTVEQWNVWSLINQVEKIKACWLYPISVWPATLLSSPPCCRDYHSINFLQGRGCCGCNVKWHSHYSCSLV